MDDEKFIEPTRAWRRRQKERKIQQAYRRGLAKNWREKDPEEYWFLDPDNEDDMLDIWAMDSEMREPYSARRRRGSDWVIYIEGQGVINPPEPIYCPWHNTETTEHLPYLTDEEIQEDILSEAKKVADNQAACSCSVCGNPRRKGTRSGSAGTLAEHKEFHDAIAQLDDENLFVEKKRLKRRFAKNGY